MFGLMRLADWSQLTWSSTYQRLQRSLVAVAVVAVAAAVGVKTNHGTCLHPGHFSCSWDGDVCAAAES